jgi:hypothetical protein
VQEHVDACPEVLGVGVLGRVVADALFAGHEDHAGRAHPGQHLRVVAGARGKAAHGVAQPDRCRFDQVDHPGVELHGLEPGQAPR